MFCQSCIVMTKKLTLILVAMAIVCNANAQIEENRNKENKNSQGNALDEYEKFKQQAIEEYESFRQKANAEYAKFLEEAWKPFEAKPSEEIPWKPKPPRPIYAENEPVINPQPAPEPIQKPLPDPIQSPNPIKSSELETKPTTTPDPVSKPDPIVVPDINVPEESAPTPELSPVLPNTTISTPTTDPLLTRSNSEQILFDNIVRVPTQIDRPQPIEPIIPKPVPTMTAQTLYLYGSTFPFYFSQEKRSLKLKDISEKSVAKMWTQLSDSYYDNLIVECLQQRKDRNLCDWAYLKLTENVAEKYCGKDTNEAIVMQMYLLTQSGYQMRIARSGEQLTLLIGSVEKIFRYKYFQIDDLKFYIIDRTLEDQPMKISNHAFPGEKPFSMTMMQPKLNVERTEKRTIVSKRYPDVKVTIETNKNLIDFYNECPLSAQWNYYSKASLSNVLKEKLYPALREAIKDKNELDAVNILLNFVQTGFEYATDGQQFGYERPLYPDETFFYPYCDCEDRSILFSCLVRELVGLDVVLLNYPEHLAAAVHFNMDEVSGDYLIVDDKTYFISDPTFIGAPVGRCAREYKSVKPKVIKI